MLTETYLVHGSEFSDQLNREFPPPFDISAIVNRKVNNPDQCRSNCKQSEPVIHPRSTHFCRRGKQSMFKDYFKNERFNLTIMFAYRNDGYAGGIIKLQAALDLLNYQLREFARRSLIEIILVDWNPPAEASGLASLIRAPLDIALFRVITVPSEIHSCLSTQVGADNSCFL